MMGATIYIYFFSAITRFQPYQLALLFLFGMYYTIMGAGLNVFNMLFKRYITVDDKGINIKKSIFKGKHESSWNDITEIQINITAIRFKVKNSSELQIEHQQLEEETAHKLKTAIIHQAKEQGINIA